MIPPSIAMASPSIGIPLNDRITNSPPATIAHSEMLADRKMQNPISLFFGIRRRFPAMRNSPQSSDINTEDKATLSGETPPKNSAISLPEENPAPIAVPI